MNKKFILQNVLKKIDYVSAKAKAKEDGAIIEAVEEARKEIEQAEEYFHCIKDPQLIDYAIYRQEAARCRYMYLLNRAKERGLKATIYNSFNESNAT